MSPRVCVSWPARSATPTGGDRIARCRGGLDGLDPSALSGQARNLNQKHRPTPQDIQHRDQLIARPGEPPQRLPVPVQRSTSTDRIPGGCPDFDRTAPGPVPGTPVFADLVARDRLIAAQESLLDTTAAPTGCWTQNWSRKGAQESQRSQPAPHGFTSISVWISGHSCGIRADSTAVCWGNNDSDGQADAPAGRFTAISVGSGHSCGIRADSTAVCWGGWRRYWRGRMRPSGRVHRHLSRCSFVRDQGRQHRRLLGSQPLGQADCARRPVHRHLKPAALFRARDQGRQHRRLLGQRGG